MIFFLVSLNNGIIYVPVMRTTLNEIIRKVWIQKIPFFIARSFKLLLRPVACQPFSHLFLAWAVWSKMKDRFPTSFLNHNWKNQMNSFHSCIKLNRWSITVIKITCFLFNSNFLNNTCMKHQVVTENNFIWRKLSQTILNCNGVISSLGHMALFGEFWKSVLQNTILAKRG